MRTRAPASPASRSGSSSTTGKSPAHHLRGCARADYTYTLRIHPHRMKVYDVAVPNKTIYVSDGDLKLYQRAQELAGGNLSAAIARRAQALRRRPGGPPRGLRRRRRPRGRRHRAQGPVHRRPGRRVARQPRPSAPTTTASGAAARASTSSTWSAQPDWWTVDAEGKPVAGWRGRLGIGDVRYGSVPKESTLEVVATARRAPRQGPARALRHGRALRAPADRGGARHLSRGAARRRPGRCPMTARPPPRARATARARHPGPRPAQVVRQAGRPRRHRPRCPRGHRVRPARPERRRQDDRDPHPLDADLGRRRRGRASAGFDVAREPDAVRGADRPHRPGLGGRRPVHGRGEPAPDGRPPPPAARRRAGGGSPSCSSGSTSSTPRPSPR